MVLLMNKEFVEYVEMGILIARLLKLVMMEI
jgi:hypothetical protein